MNLSINMVVRNEAKRLEILLPLLRSQFPGAEIVMVDQRSLDATEAVARPLVDNFVVDEPTGNADTSRQLCMDSSSPDRHWILTVDADEFVTTRFAEEIPELMTRSVNGYMIHFMDLQEPATLEEILAAGRFIDKRHESRCCQYRLYRRNCVRLGSALHSGIGIPHGAIVQNLRYNGIVQYKTPAEESIDAVRYAAVANGTYNKDLHP